MATCGYVFWRVGGMRLHWAEGLHSSERTLGRAHPLSVSLVLCAPSPQVQQQSLCSTLWFHSIVLPRLLTYKLAPLKRGISWKQTKAASWGISSPAAVRGWCWRMFKSITAFWTLMFWKINHLNYETIKMPEVIAKSSSANFYCIYSHAFPGQRERQTVATQWASFFFLCMCDCSVWVVLPSYPLA